MSVFSKLSSSMSSSIGQWLSSITSRDPRVIMALAQDPYAWLIGGAVGLVTYWLYGLFKARNLPPGPRRLPIVGNLIAIVQQPDPAYIYFHKIAPRYGPLMTVSVGPFTAVIINNMEGMRETLIKHQNEFAGRPMNTTATIFSEGGKDIIFSDVGPSWSIHRRLAMTAMKQYAAQDTLSQLIHDCTTEVCELMVERKEAFEPRTTIYLIVYNVLAGLCFGKHYSFDDEDFQWLMKCLKIVNDEFGTGLLADFVPSLAFLPTPGKRRLAKVFRETSDYMNKFIVEHVNSFDSNNIRDITDAVILAQQQFEQEGVEDMSLFTEMHRRLIIVDIFIAGTDTTMFTVYWIIAALMTYPNLQEEIHAEIDATVGRNKLITYKDREKLPHTLSIIYEVMRYRPIVPLALPHKVLKTVQINGYTIPKDTIVFPSLYSCNFDKACWKEPEKFDPSRFLSEDGKIMSKPDGFVPFSAGRRQCAGEHVARIDIFLTFTNIMQKVRFLPDPNRKEPYSMDMSREAGPFLCEPTPYKILAEMR